MIPRHFIDDLVARTDVVEIIDGYVPLRKKGKNYSACCPFHEEKTPSFSVSQEKQFYYCFGCGAGGNVISFLMEYARLDFVEAIHELAARAGISVPEEKSAASKEPHTDSPARQDLYKVLEQAAAYYHGQLLEQAETAPVWQYIGQRGLNKETVEIFNLGYAPPGWDNLLKACGGKDAQQQTLLNEAGLLNTKDEGGRFYDRFRDRLIFPIHDQRGRVVAFGGRVLEADAKPKYLNSPETPVFHKGNELYALHRVRKLRPAPLQIVVVEGYTDVVALAQYGIQNVVATLGTSTGTDHLNRLFRSVDQVVFCFDGDEAGAKAAWRALENALPLLKSERRIAFMFLPEGEDPDSLVRAGGAQAFLDLQAKARPLAEFLFSHLSADLDLNRVEDQARLLEAARPLLGALPNGVVRQSVQSRLRDFDTRNLSHMAPMPEDLSGAQAEQAIRAARRFVPQHAIHKQTPSPMRTVMALLVQNPQLAEQAAEIYDLAGVELPGLSLLFAVLEFIHANPHVHTGIILEHWRGSEHAQVLQKLAAWQHQLPDNGIKKEFSDAIQCLLRHAKEQRLEILLGKSRLGGLNDEEKQELNELATGRRA